MVDHGYGTMVMILKPCFRADHVSLLNIIQTCLNMFDNDIASIQQCCIVRNGFDNISLLIIVKQ
jgi:hypothetical protein